MLRSNFSSGHAHLPRSQRHDAAGARGGRPVARCSARLWGNASSVHHFGQQAKAVLDDARAPWPRSSARSPRRWSSPGAAPRATTCHPRRRRGARAAGRTAPGHHGIEHEAVLNTVKALARAGGASPSFPVDASGIVDPGRAARGGDRPDRAGLGDARQQRDRHGAARRPPSRPDRAGARRPVPHRRGADAGKIPVDVARLGVDMLSISATSSTAPRASAPVGAARRAPAPVHDRRTPGAQPARRHRERPGHRRHGRRRHAGARPAGRRRARLAALRDRLEARASSPRCPARGVNGAASRACPTRRTSASSASRPSRC
jgi:cysteine desulfurase